MATFRRALGAVAFAIVGVIWLVTGVRSESHFRIVLGLLALAAAILHASLLWRPENRQ